MRWQHSAIFVGCFFLSQSCDLLSNRVTTTIHFTTTSCNHQTRTTCVQENKVTFFFPFDRSLLYGAVLEKVKSTNPKEQKEQKEKGGQTKEKGGKEKGGQQKGKFAQPTCKYL